MTEYFIGHKTDPSEKVKQAFEKIAEQDMKDMPFLHPDVQVDVHAFQMYEDQWIGAVLTPWMLSVFILPGPTQEWPLRKVGSKLGVSFPRKNLPFIVGDIEGVGQYLSCSLMSPLDRKKSGAELREIACACIEELVFVSEDEKNASSQQKERRRFLLRPIE